jgi:class 3 adenylate cyclase
MAAFDEVANAVRAAADIQRHFFAYNAEASEGLRVRIGIHAGEPVAVHNDLFGSTVQLAFRLCSEAEADDINVSGLVRDLCDGDAARFVALGERRLKGLPKRRRCFGWSGGIRSSMLISLALFLAGRHRVRIQSCGAQSISSAA